MSAPSEEDPPSHLDEGAAVDEDALVDDDPDDRLLGGGRPIWRCPPDLDTWVTGAGGALVAAAALQTLAYIVWHTAVDWGTGERPPGPGGYFSLVLLAGVVVVAVGRRHAARASSRWVAAIACAAAGTAGALIVAQVVSAVQALSPQYLQPGGSGVAISASLVLTILNAVPAVAAIVPATLLYRLSRGAGSRRRGTRPSGRAGIRSAPPSGPWCWEHGSPPADSSPWERTAPRTSCRGSRRATSRASPPSSHRPSSSPRPPETSTSRLGQWPRASRTRTAGS